MQGLFRVNYRGLLPDLMTGDTGITKIVPECFSREERN